MTKKRKDDFLRSRKCVQIMRIMKFYVLLMAFGMLHAYGNVHSQNLTLNMENVSLKEVFKEIEAKSDYHFLFRSDDVVEIKGLTLSVNMADIDEVLALCFKGTRLIYEKDGFLIIVKKGTRINAPRFHDPAIRRCCYRQQEQAVVLSVFRGLHPVIQRAGGSCQHGW